MTGPDKKDAKGVNKQSRRDFLQTAGATVTGLVLAPHASAGRARGVPGHCRPPRGSASSGRGNIGGAVRPSSGAEGGT